MDVYSFYIGKEFEAYKTQGAHVENGGVRFCTFAPAAKKVAVIGEFNNWQEQYLNPVNDGNFYELFVPQAKENQLYMENPALYESDYDKKGFRWIDCHQEKKAVYVLERQAVTTNQKIIALFNFSDKMWENYSFEVLDVDKLKVLLSSDEMKYGGTGTFKSKTLTAKEGKVTLDVPPMCGIYFTV